MADQLTRIGRGVPGADRGKRRLKPQVYWVLAAAVLIAVGTMVAVVYFLDPPQQKPVAQASGLPIQTQIECEAIKHAHDVWEGGRDELDRIPAIPAGFADLPAERLAREGSAYFDAVSNRPDQSAKALAVAVAQYNYELSVMNLTLVASDRLDTGAYEKTVAAWIAAEQSYGQFRQLTCGSG